MTFWLIGSLAPTENWDKVISILPFVVGGVIISYLYSRDLNILALGEDQAQHLGVEIEKVKRILLVAGALLTAAAVSISGLIGFVGLIIPHLTRILIGPDHRVLLPTSAIVGATFLMLCDALSRVVMGSGEAPVGVITAFAGLHFSCIFCVEKRKVTPYKVTRVVVLTIDGVDCSYGSVEILKDINFKVNSGEFLGILGPNGSGKSTLLKSISRVLKPKKGAIIIDDKNVYNMKTIELARQMAVVPQTTDVSFDFTALEVVLMGRNPHMPRFKMEGQKDLDIAKRQWK